MTKKTLDGITGGTKHHTGGGMRLILATRNAHKLHEAGELLAQLGIELVGLDAWPELPEVPEDHETFEENALQKAHFVHSHTGLPTIADDSGIEVDALGGAPGVHSKRFTPEATAAANNARLLRDLTGRDDRGARFRCALAVVCDAGEQVLEGRCEGTIGTAPVGEGGFGYDPLFWPAEAPGRAMAQLSTAEKNRISHRGRALAQLPAALAGLGLIDAA